MPEKTPGEPNLPSRIYQPTKISSLWTVIKYRCLENPKRTEKILKKKILKKKRI